MSYIACHDRPLTAHTNKRHRAWHAIITLGLQTRSDDIGHRMTSSPSDRAWMPSSPFGSTHRWTTSGVACHYRTWMVDMVRRLGAWYVIFSLGHHTRLDDVERCCSYGPWEAHSVDDVGRGKPSSPLVSTHRWTTLDMTYHHRPWVEHTVERHQAWHSIIALG